jgi:hypothetical protein
MHARSLTLREIRHVVGVPYHADSLRFIGLARRGFESESWRERAQVQVDIERERLRILEERRRAMLDDKIAHELDRIGAAAQEHNAEIRARVDRLGELLRSRYADRPELERVRSYADELGARIGLTSS